MRRPGRDRALSDARRSIRVVERFCYRDLGEAENDLAAKKARGLLRLAVGLRRKLDLEGER